MLSPEERRLVAQRSLGATPSVLFLRPIFRVGDARFAGLSQHRHLSCLLHEPFDITFVLHFARRALYVEAAGIEVELMKSEMPQGTLDMVILQVVAAGPIHGYALAHRIRLISRDLLQIQQGSLYPALHRLENRGFMAAEWKESESGRDAKFYRLTPKGRAQLKKETTNWARLSEAIALILQAAE